MTAYSCICWLFHRRITKHTYQHRVYFRTTTKHTILTELINKTHLPAQDTFQNYYKIYVLTELIYKTQLAAPGQFQMNQKYTILTELMYKIHLPAQGQFHSYHEILIIDRTNTQNTRTSTGTILEVVQNT